ncbi:MAG: AraC family transcriptional regulator [Inconstantimicrobium porci]|uniref:helix-turn-helix domain-containing protein n=1 Tax=Inconstantimicrobium porci TaxID=2652291 RepID=UPI00240A07B5|nr:AraC family transcriptional regulator [Inconstantimicrobium porci]MDD6770863.1 AraC family transcriptional regulator [Inconstantimicrobium porci]MDY5912953.1 AraC family transcriptional regulator [Inconstantimicrobium porci]
MTKKFNMNRTTLSEKFNRLVGETIITYINKLRVNIATTLLRDTRVPISEIMEIVGFNDSSYFFRTFKIYKGQSPKEYRDEYC